MRLTTIAGIAALGISAAAIAQVASTPAEQKPAPSSQTMSSNMVMANDTAPANGASSDDMTTTMGNDVAAPHPEPTPTR